MQLGDARLVNAQLGANLLHGQLPLIVQGHHAAFAFGKALHGALDDFLLLSTITVVERIVALRNQGLFIGLRQLRYLRRMQPLNSRGSKLVDGTVPLLQTNSECLGHLLVPHRTPQLCLQLAIQLLHLLILFSHVA